MNEKQLMRLKEADVIIKELKYEKIGGYTIYEVSELIDKRTGVCYLLTVGREYSFSITPRLNPDGTPMIADISYLTD